MPASYSSIPMPVVVNNVSIEQLVYKDQIVVTFAQIAQVHSIPERNVHRSFERHREHFVEGKHFYRIDYAEAVNLPLGVEVSRNGLTLFTESGYLLLVKPMRDEQSWVVQERMIEAYFRLKAIESSREVPFVLPESLTQALVSMATGITALTGTVLSVDTRVAEVSARVDAMDTRLKEIETRTDTAPGYMTLMGYSRKKHFRLNISEARHHGKELRKLAVRAGVHLGKAPDERWGEVNTYPCELLDEYFEPVLHAENILRSA